MPGFEVSGNKNALVEIIQQVHQGSMGEISGHIKAIYEGFGIEGVFVCLYEIAGRPAIVHSETHPNWSSGVINTLGFFRSAECSPLLLASEFLGKSITKIPPGRVELPTCSRDDTYAEAVAVDPRSAVITTSPFIYGRYANSNTLHGWPKSAGGGIEIDLRDQDTTVRCFYNVCYAKTPKGKNVSIDLFTNVSRLGCSELSVRFCQELIGDESFSYPRREIKLLENIEKIVLTLRNKCGFETVVKSISS